MDPVSKLLIYAVVTALSVAAQFLLAPKPPKNPLDDSKTEPSKRGGILGVLVGHMRIGPVIGYVGGRWAHKESVESSGGKGGSKSQKQTVYFEHGWHLLNCGEGRTLRKIMQNGKTIWEGNLSPSSSPSGALVALGKGEKMAIYWGDLDQPLNTSLAEAVGVESTWPGVMYIWWESKRLGTTAIWPQLEYEFTAEPSSTGKSTGEGFMVLDSDPTEAVPFEVYNYAASKGGVAEYIGSFFNIRAIGGSSLPALEAGQMVVIRKAGVEMFSTYVVSKKIYKSWDVLDFVDPLPQEVLDAALIHGSGWQEATGYTFDSFGFANQGANPGAALDQFLFQPRPRGAGLDSSLFDNSLADVCDLARLEGTPTTSLLRSGKSWKDGLASIMQDLGIFLYFDAATGLYGFKPVRSGDAVTEISENLYDSTKLFDKFGYSTLSADSRVFTYRDSARDFADSTLPATDDSLARYGADPNVKSVALETIVSAAPASIVASRRDAEMSVDEVTTVPISYTFNPRIGDAVTLEGFSTRYRVASVETNPDEASRTLGLIGDAYVTDSAYDLVDPQGISLLQAVAPDMSTAILELNRFTSPDTHGYLLLRIRTGQASKSAYVYDSPDNTSYDFSGEAAAGVGGILVSPIPENTGSILDGITFTTINKDYENLADLSGSGALWRSGQQMCLIGSELFYLQSTEGALVGDEIQVTMNGLMRARQGTNKQAHGADELVFIFDSNSLVPLSKSWMLPGQDLYVKSSPYNDTSSTPIENSNKASILPYQGGGYRPLPPENLNSVLDVPAWIAGEDLALRWDYKSGVAGAGVMLSDEPTELVLPEGYFRLTFKDGTTAVRTEEVLIPSFTYTQAMILADFGSEPTAFTVEVVEILNGLSSEVESTVFARV